MNREDRNAPLTVLIVVLIGASVAWAGSQGSASAFGIPIYAIAVTLAFLIQWAAFIPAYVQRTERFFDLTGSITYITVTTLAVVLSPRVDGRSLLLLVLVMIWAGRLGTFLFQRVRKKGKDARFDDIKTHFGQFLNTWTLQGLWVTLTLSAALAAITTAVRKPLDLFALVGSLVWAAGFAIEVVADSQKRRFRADPEHEGDFIDTGLWAWSRHPNYFGEIVLWIGATIIALPALRGWQWIGLISPIFVAVLLTRISGVPILEKRADKRWAGQPDYEAYKARTPVLIPRPPAER